MSLRSCVKAAHKTVPSATKSSYNTRLHGQIHESPNLPSVIRPLPHLSTQFAHLLTTHMSESLYDPFSRPIAIQPQLATQPLPGFTAEQTASLQGYISAQIAASNKAIMAEMKKLMDDFKAPLNAALNKHFGPPVQN